MDWTKAVRNAAALAEKAGYLTFDQLNDLTPPGIEPEEVEAILSALSDRGIWIVEE